MSLAELTADKHKQAEKTCFMRAVFDKSMDTNTWADWTLQKSAFYSLIEDQCSRYGHLDDLPGIRRAKLLRDDYDTMCRSNQLGEHVLRPLTIKYCDYINTLDQQRILAHLYTWHMGDMFGGQMIRKIINAPHTNLDFENTPGLIVAMRAKLSNELGVEANCAFDWAISMMDQYDI